MTRERTKELLPVMQAFAEGREVEFRRKSVGHDWTVATHPDWLGGFDYRIQPEPREWWAVQYSSNNVKSLLFDELKAAQEYLARTEEFKPSPIFKVREVL